MKLPCPGASKHALRIRVYPVICDAVLLGVQYGLKRAFKHRDEPAPDDSVANAIADAVMSELGEVVDFGD